MFKHLILNLESPLMSFGGETVDNLGVIRPFPAVSMLTGLLANALGWRRVERQRHQELQERIVFAARIDREPHGGLRLTDFQSAAINNTEQSWTTRGRPEGRGGGTYQNHLRWRDYHADMSVTVALRLDPADGDPALDAVAEALEEPARPLFIGRKPCLPSRPILRKFGDDKFMEGETALTALLAVPLRPPEDETSRRSADRLVRLLWPDGEDAPGMDGVRINRRAMLTDQRNWVSGLHGGGRLVCEGTARRERFASLQPQEGWET